MSRSAVKKAAALPNLPPDQIAALPADELLLRGSEPPIAVPGELLRAAQEGTVTEAGELMRANNERVSITSK